jgi:hypothetical protein
MARAAPRFNLCPYLAGSTLIKGAPASGGDGRRTPGEHRIPDCDVASAMVTERVRA